MKCRNIRLIFVMCYDTWHLYINFDFYINYLNILLMSKEQDAKLKALQLTVDRLEKTYGKGAVMKLGDKQVVEVDTIPTGSLSLDVALGINGLPRGRVVEIYGPESSGKTTLAERMLYYCGRIQEKQHSPYMPLPNVRKKVALLLSLMLSMHLTDSTLKVLV